jgi:hypothetical protein
MIEEEKTYYGPNDNSRRLGRVVHEVAHLWPQVVLPVLCLLSWESALTVWGRGKREERVGSVVVVVVDGGGVGRWSWCYGWCWCDVMFNIHHVMCWGWAEMTSKENNSNKDEKSPFLGWKMSLNIHENSSIRCWLDSWIQTVILDEKHPRPNVWNSYHFQRWKIIPSISATHGMLFHLTNLT